MKKVLTGLDKLKDPDISRSIKGNVGYLCHAPSVDQDLNHGINIVREIFGERFKKIFSPQHGLFGDLQDNMIESDHFFHPFFKRPVYSLYSETRKPTNEMLEGLDHLIIDLQDVGTRIYTYIWTLVLTMEAAGENGVEVIVLDRPNPINGIDIEGNILESEFSSFVGLHPLPMRHGFTMGEVAQYSKNWKIDSDFRVIQMEGWDRKSYFEQTGLPWVIPSPNLPTIETAVVYPGTVIFEGTNISEGRGTTRSLELVGHPSLEPFGLMKNLQLVFEKCDLRGFVCRPLIFTPTFQKHKDQVCGGFQIHVTNRKLFQPWKVGMTLCRELYRALGSHFIWKSPPYEYEFNNMPFDILNGSDSLRKWVENNGDFDELTAIEQLEDFNEQRKDYLLY